MFFNSLEFAPFCILAFILYWSFHRNKSMQNLLLLLASLLFYGWWDWRFISLLLFSTVLDYTFGFLVANEDTGKRKLFLYLSIFNNLLVLCIFKYYNFFITETASMLASFEISFNPRILEIALPVGISFYTFH